MSKQAIVPVSRLLASARVTQSMTLERSNTDATLAHLLAAAVMELADKRTIGPAMVFYFDFEFRNNDRRRFSAIEKKIVNSCLHGRRLSVLNSLMMQRKITDNPYKAELIDQFSGEGQTLTFINRNLLDLCRGRMRCDG